MYAYSGYEIRIYHNRDEMATTAILDRLFHKSQLFNIDGRSYRLKDFDQMLKKDKKEKQDNRNSA